MTLRISAGQFKGRVLKSPLSATTRPSSMKVRQSVFNQLFDLINEADLLDVYAGSGAVGFEALSREAKSATFIESNQRAVKVIQDNASLLGVESQVKILRGDAALSLKNLLTAKASFDIIFMDPPYKLLQKVTVHDFIEPWLPLLHKEGILFLEMALGDLKNQKLDESSFRVNRYGDTALVRYKQLA